MAGGGGGVEESDVLGWDRAKGCNYQYIVGNALRKRMLDRSWVSDSLNNDEVYGQFLPSVTHSQLFTNFLINIFFRF